MSGRPAALCAALALAACSARHDGGDPQTPAPAPAGASTPASTPGDLAGEAVRFFHALGDDTFWVSHAPDLDRLIVGGARLEALPSGEIRAAAWDVDLAARGEGFTGALAVPERLGGGFVFWTHARLFGARDFTGPLAPVALGIQGEVHVRGARTGPASVFVLTNAGPRELRPGADRLTAVREPALVDAVALSASRAARLDVFGRVGVTADAGATWADLSPVSGLGVAKLVAGESDLWIEGPLGRFLVTSAGKLEPIENGGSRGGDYDTPKTLQTVFQGTRAAQRESWPWTLHDTTPLELVVGAGAAVGDGTAFGLTQSTVVRVDLRTGAPVAMISDWFPSGLACQPVAAADGVLFACVWERSSGYGGYVFRSIGGAPPRLEKVFTDDGSFVADGEGALGYVGSCRAAPRAIDLNDRGRYEDGEAPLAPVFCVRSGPGIWAERRIEVARTDQLAAWVPHRDGSATALVVSGDPLPPPVSAPRAAEASGVHVVRVHRETPGWGLTRPAWQPDRGGQSGWVDRRFRALDDGSIDAWLSPTQDSVAGTVVAATFDPAGVSTLHPLPPGAVTTITGGAFALSITREGDLYETTDHGRTFRPAGRSPVPAAPAFGLACSALGCTLGAVLRLGWGPATTDPRILVTTDPLPAAPPVPLQRLVCTPRGAPTPLVGPPPAPADAQQTLLTGWGDTLEIIRDTSVPEPASPPPHPGRRPPSASPSASPSATPSASPSVSPSARPPGRKPPRPSPAVLRTHTLVMRPPFAPLAPVRRINATDADWSTQHRSPIAPLLTPSGDVDLLIYAEPNELLVSGDRVTVLPSFQATRPYYGRGDADLTGLVLPGGRALVLGDARQRLTLEDHGPGDPTAPVYLGLPRERQRRRPVTLARRDDGALGVLVLDGSAPEGAGVAPLDRRAAAVSSLIRLAPWSALRTADDPRCRKGDDPGAYRAIVLVDPSLWLALDPASLPGLKLGATGMMLVRWGVDRVCLEALDVGVLDPGKQRGETPRWLSLVVRWGGEKKDQGAALRALDVRQDLVCSIGPAERVGR